jgi:hypothetical protein
MKPNYPRATKQPSIFLILGAIALMIFVFLYPPFLNTSFTIEHKTVRIFFEGFILVSLAIYVSKRDSDIFPVLLVVLLLYLMNWFFSKENIENVLSYFNKFAFLLLISAVLRRKNDLALLAKNVWITFWVYSSITGAIGYFLLISNLVSPTLIVGLEEGLGRYDFYNYPLIGNYFIKSSDLFPIPRYTGFLVEPIMAGLFFGFNMIVAKQLIVDTKKCRRFLTLNMMAGMLTMSYAFFIFLVFFFCLRSKMIIRLVSKKVILILVIGFIGLIIMIASIISIHYNVDELLPYSSLGQRVHIYALSLEVFREQSLGTLVFGAGIAPFNEAIGGGASAGIIDVLGSRGIILLGIWLCVLYMKARQIPGLFAFVLLYSLVLDYWHFPLFIIGLAIVASLESSRVRGRIAPSLPTNTIYRSGPARLGGI